MRTVAICVTLLVLLGCSPQEFPTVTPEPTPVPATATAVPPIATPVPTPTPTPASWGPYGRFELRGDGPGKHEVYLTVNEIRDPAPPSPLLPLRPGNRYLGIDITLEIEQDAKLQNLSNNPPSFRISDSISGDYARPLDVYGPDFFVFRRMQPGEKARGWVIFELPLDANVSTFSYSVLDVEVILFKWKR